MSETAEAKTGKRNRIVFRITAILLLLLLIPGGIVFSLTPYAFREIWLPAAAASAGATIRAEEIRLESLFPFRLKTAGLHYSGPGIDLKIRSARSQLRVKELKRHRVELYGTRIEGLRIVSSPVPPKTAASALPDQKVGGPPAGQEPDRWTFSMADFQVKEATVEIKDQDQKVMQIWTASNLCGDRFRTGVRCHVSAESTLAAFPGRQNPVRIRKLPFRMQADYLLAPDFRLKDFSGTLETGIFDLSITEEIVIPAEAGISAAVKIRGGFPDPDTLHIARSEIGLFKDRKKIGELHLQGIFGSTFQCSGTCTGLDLEPCLAVLSPGSRARMEVTRAEVHLTGSDFSAAGLRRDLKIRLIAGLRNISVPIVLNRQSRLMRLVLIPVEAMPKLVDLLEKKWSLKRHVGRCLDTVKAVVSGQQNLNFKQAEMDLSMENGKLKISEFVLTGDDIEMESLRGTLDLGTEELDLRTTLVVQGIKFPLDFNGSLNQPQPRFREALKEFMLLNAPLLEKLDKLLTEPVSEKDSRLEKAIKRGYRDLNRMLQ